MFLVSGAAILQDVKYGLRTLARTPWASTVIVLSLAVGIGVNTAVFTAYRAFVDRLIDARNPEEIVNMAVLRDSGAAEFFYSNPDYETYRDSVGAFSGLIAYRPLRVTISNTGGGRATSQGSALGRLGLFASSAIQNAEFAQVYGVSENYFEVLGVAALHGRTFSSAKRDETPGVVISANYWQRRFAGDPSILGKTIHLNGLAVAIIGVAPPDFVGTGVAAPAFWLPITLEPQLNADPNWLHDRENRRYRLFGRLAPSVTSAQATAQVSVIADQLRKLHAGPDAAKPVNVLIWPGSPFPLPLSYYPGLNLSIVFIMAGAAMVLAVAAANAGSLQLAQARSRETELRTRLSLGATRSRIIRQLLTENALTGLFAGILAIFFSWAFLKLAVRAFVESMPIDFAEFVFDVNPNMTVFAYVTLVSLIAGILAGLTPALHSPSSALSAAGRSSTASFRGRRLQDLLVALQVAFTLVLIITGTMFVRGATNSLALETGYDIRNLAQVDFQFPAHAGYSSERKAAFVEELRQKILALPGVAKVTSARPPGSSVRTAVAPVDSGPAVRSLHLHYTYVQGDYFETLGIPLSAGRTFDPRNQNPQAVVLSESAARQLFPGHAVNPVGRNLRLGPIDEKPHPSAELKADGPVYEVIGIVRDTRAGAEFDGSDSMQVYLPLTAGASAATTNRPLIIRTQGASRNSLAAIEQAVVATDPQVLESTSTLEEGLRRAPPFGVSLLAAAFASFLGSFGLLLAVIGIFGTVSHIVVLRTREVGIRMAIGAQRRDVLRLILGESSRPVVVGLTAGMLLAAGAVYLLRGILYGVNQLDGVYFFLISLFFLAVALLAAYPPARRAMRVEPVVALRYE